MLETTDLSFIYPRSRRQVLDNVSLSIAPGGIYGLLGVNGVGKSTLLYLLTGVLMPDSGSVTLDGVATFHRHPSTMADLFIVTEEVQLPPLSVKKFVETTSPFYPRFSHEEMTSRLSLMGIDPEQRLDRMSMGQRKKAYICFALSCNTTYLLMDEPTNGLDIPGKDIFRSLIASAMTDDRAIVISTHQVRDIDLLLDHVIILDSSRAVLCESLEKVGRKISFTAQSPLTPETEILYTRPSISGNEIITVNRDGTETRVDIEMLFNFAISRPSLIQSIFESHE